MRAVHTRTSSAARSRLHRLTFDDIQSPEKGGRYDVLLDGTGPHQMLDNITIDGDGNLILQLLRNNLQSSDWDRFDHHADDEFDERCKWAKRGYRYHLAVTHAHYSPGDPELIEGGQLWGDPWR